jgi:hypothetical protein
MKLALSSKNAWDLVGPSLKTALSPILDAIPQEYLLGRRFRQHLRFLEGAQWWSADRSHAYQLQQLRRICALAHQRAPYFQRTFSSLGFTPHDLASIEDLRHGPPLLHRLGSSAHRIRISRLELATGRLSPGHPPRSPRGRAVPARAQCEKSSNYHVWPTYGLFELLDDHSRPVTTPGQRGEIVGTGFINTVVPFIRYRTGDHATYVADHCGDCGRAHPIITDIRGHRTQETLVAGDGSLIPWAALNMHDDTFDRVVRFQFYQDTPGHAVLRLIPAPDFTEDDRRRILTNLSRKIDQRLQLTVHCTEAIPLAARAKAIYVDQRIPGRPSDNQEAS